VCSSDLVANEGRSYNESQLDYWGTLIGVITSLMDDDTYSWLSFRVSDYADWTLTKKYVNELFPDYI
jgi:starvation-inducible outer membrane lipoprotein